MSFALLGLKKKKKPQCVVYWLSLCVCWQAVHGTLNMSSSVKSRFHGCYAEVKRLDYYISIYHLLTMELPPSDKHAQLRTGRYGRLYHTVCVVALWDTTPWPTVAQKRDATAATRREGGRGMQDHNHEHMLVSARTIPRDRRSSTLGLMNGLGYSRKALWKQTRTGEMQDKSFI